MQKQNVLLLGKGGIVVADVQDHLSTPDVQLYGGGSIEDLRTTFAKTRIDHVIMGAGLPLEARLEIVREIFLLSNTTTVHMKDYDSGPDGFVPFVRSVLTGLATLEI